MGAVVFWTDTDSPVRGASSTWSEIEFRCTTLKSAGTLSPMFTSTTSPGTRFFESWIVHTPSLNNLHSTACISFKASKALSAFESYQIDIIEFATRISKMTNGSTYAVIPSSLSPIRKILKNLSKLTCNSYN